MPNIHVLLLLLLLLFNNSMTKCSTLVNIIHPIFTILLPNGSPWLSLKSG